MISFAGANHFIKLLNFGRLFLPIQPVPWVFAYELFMPML